MISAMRPRLAVDERTRQMAQLVLKQRAPSLLTEPMHALISQAGIDLLPDWARRMHGLPAPFFSVPLVRAGTFGMAETIRWAFQG